MTEELGTAKVGPMDFTAKAVPMYPLPVGLYCAHGLGEDPSEDPTDEPMDGTFPMAREPMEDVHVLAGEDPAEFLIAELGHGLGDDPNALEPTELIAFVAPTRVGVDFALGRAGTELPLEETIVLLAVRGLPAALMGSCTELAAWPVSPMR